MNGLVLEGGAMRGLFTCGVLDVFLENEISFDMVTGVSAGAAFGCNFKSKQKGRGLRYNLRFCKDKRYCSLRSLLKTGNMYNAEFCYHTLPDTLDVFDYETYRANPVKFFAVTTDITLGTPVYYELSKCDYTELELMRASASMPLVSKPLEHEGRLLLDGGITDSIPLKFSQEKGCTKNVVILTQCRTYKKRPSKITALLPLLLHKYPALVRAMKERPFKYNAQTEYVFAEEKKGSTFVICPDEPLGISRTCKDKKELQRVYDTGRAKAEKILDELRAFLSRFHD